MKMDLGPDSAAFVTLLTDEDERPWPAEIVSVSGRTLTILCDLTAPVDTPVRIESPDYVFLAETLTSDAAHRKMVLYIRHVFNINDVDHMRQKWE
jgi:hypothetical protein